MTETETKELFEEYLEDMRQDYKKNCFNYTIQRMNYKEKRCYAMKIRRNGKEYILFTTKRSILYNGNDLIRKNKDIYFLELTREMKKNQGGNKHMNEKTLNNLFPKYIEFIKRARVENFIQYRNSLNEGHEFADYDKFMDACMNASNLMESIKGKNIQEFNFDGKYWFGMTYKDEGKDYIIFTANGKNHAWLLTKEMIEEIEQAKHIR